MEPALPLGGIVTGFCVTGRTIDCLCGKELLKLDKGSGEILCRKAVFEKEGLSRTLLAEGGQIFIYDFCTFYIFNQADFSLLGSWRLGQDLRSDICGMAADDGTVYCSIRNGKIAAIHRQTFAMREYKVSDSSMWSLNAQGKGLLCGTVDGRLLLLDKGGMSIKKSLALSRKNIASLYRDGDALYAASHDGKLFKISISAFKSLAMAKNAHKKMFSCAGLYSGMLATVSYPCSELAFWDKDTLEKRGAVEIPLKLSGRAHIEGDVLYLTSRNMLGIDRLSLQELAGSL